MKRGLLIGLLCFLSLLAGAQSRQIHPSGEHHVFTVLVEFRNVRFSMEAPQTHFSEMLNGRVQAYFKENSLGHFVPTFDVYGPVLLDAPMADYGQDVMVAGERVGDVAPDRALYDACKKLDEEVNFAHYDADGDGILDMVLYYYAGYDQAAGGPADAIWSHHQDIQEVSPPEIAHALFDGVRLGYYFCTSELRGNTGTEPIGIGSTIHEMGHALGLPDFYDTNGGEQGQAGGLYQLSPMCRGMYNSDGDRPPYFNAMERILLGWMDWEDLLPLEEGWMQLDPVQGNKAAFSYTGTEGEFFLYECRNGKGWDAPLPAGLVVYHVDRSTRKLEDGVSAIWLWEHWRENNSLNARGNHPCFYVVPPMAPKDYNYAPAVNAATLVFPGSGEVRCFEPVDWENQQAGIQITCVDFQDGKSRFRVLERKGALVSGLILEGNTEAPVTGASVRLERDGVVLASDRTGMDGYYQLPLDVAVPASGGTLLLVVEKADYRTASEEFTLDPSGLSCRYVHLFAYEEPLSVRLSKYDAALSAGYYPGSGSQLGAVRFTAQELAPYAGGRIARVVCYPFVVHPEELGTLYITVDQGKLRVLNLPVHSPVVGEYLPVSVELTSAQVRIPEGVDLYVGYGFDRQGSNHTLGTVYPGGEGNSYYAPFGLGTQSWKPMYVDKAGFYMDLMLDMVVEEVPAQDLPQMGYTYIRGRRSPYYEGESWEGELVLPEGVMVNRLSWTLDGQPLESPSFVLKAGEHTLQALLTYRDGREEVVEKVFKVAR